jgi:riboflavin kinase / FMN adenylyltransferase
MFPKVYYTLSDYQAGANPAVTIGTFDGVHTGHQHVFHRLFRAAKAQRGEAVVLTFHPHPRYVLSGRQDDFKLLQTLDERLSLLAAAGIDNILVIPFDKTFSQMSSSEFIRKVLVETVKVKHLVVGYDHRFGSNRAGDAQELAQSAETYGFSTESVPPLLVDGVAISSTRIRTALLSGAIAEANEWLGYAFALSGEVVKGQQRGRLLGFPTANIVMPDPHKLVPAVGVYAVRVHCPQGIFPGMLNIGYRPTFEGNQLSIEVHLIGFEGDLYHQNIRIELLHRVRAERKFESVEALIDQLKRDQQAVLSWLAIHSTLSNNSIH